MLGAVVVCGRRRSVPLVLALFSDVGLLLQNLSSNSIQPLESSAQIQIHSAFTLTAHQSTLLTHASLAHPNIIIIWGWAVFACWFSATLRGATKATMYATKEMSLSQSGTVLAVFFL